MPTNVYVLRHRWYHNLYAKDLDGRGVVSRTNRIEHAWRGSYRSGSEAMDELERLFGCCDLVDSILVEFERYDL